MNELTISELYFRYLVMFTRNFKDSIKDGKINLWEGLRLMSDLQGIKVIAGEFDGFKAEVKNLSQEDREKIIGWVATELEQEYELSEKYVRASEKLMNKIFLAIDDFKKEIE